MRRLLAPLRPYRRHAIPLIGVLLLTLAAAVMLHIYAHRQAVAGLRADATRIARQQERLLNSELQRFRLLPIVLVEYPDLGDALRNGSRQAADRLNEKLRGLAERTGAPVIYAIDRQGRTVSASNAGQPDSFVGRNYAFRPYFRQALTQGTSEYFALGNTSHRAGLFLARRIGPANAPDGVVVVKVEFRRIAQAWASDPGQTLLTDNHGVVVVTSDPRALFTTMQALTPRARGEIEQAQQFGGVRLRPAPYRLEPGGWATDDEGNRHVVARVAVPLPGWRLIHLLPSRPAFRAADSWVRSATALIGVGLLALALLAIWRRTRAERVVQAREALEAEVARRTAELRATNDRLTIEIAERVRADQRFRAAREELAQANRLGSLGSITAGVAHEINQPVAAIRTLAENARTFLTRAAPDKAASNLSTIVELTERISSIVQEMRRFVRRGTHGMGPVALDAVLDGTMLLIGDRFRSAGVVLERPTGGSLPVVVAGRVRLEQVLVNLLQNALDAVADRPSPRVRMCVREEGDSIELTVEDNGPGLDPDIAPEIFTPFVTGKPDGLGLGLGIARDIMREFGGMLDTIPSSLGGAGFIIRLRRA
ncbi:sensor histidine kinase [Sphingomonas pseudosanguinis]|uniref:histidine kinase n=1 Tax=Sphingomonas pseudosanguinis TaxID=413712 RepID=A0A7W6AAV4_9SPHN|nr:ATP-binding protein [Sphingomonas pseudosanguinis]MBB3878778.1 two-component system C4-dicarboxylate transport sensor histidine kinase DctB [Sphingomonas pseudosanguinis]